jgi:hypothetical protein
MLACNARAAANEPTIEDWGYVGRNIRRPTVQEIKEAIVAHGPVTANVNSTRSFQHYTGGIFNDRNSDTTNHLVVLVGWDDTKGAWLLRNSWSARWGEAGYMWIKYGSNAVGEWATWVEPRHAPPPPDPTFADRYLSLANDSGEPLDVSLQAEVPEGTGFRWMPATPSTNASAWTIKLPAGATLDVKRPDNRTLLVARNARIWATSADGKRVWTQNRAKDFVLAASPYSASRRERSTFHFGRPEVPAATADALFADADTARKRADFARASTLYKRFVDEYPSDRRIHTARFFSGYAQYKQRSFDPAILAFAETIGSAPLGDPTIPFSAYYLGMSGAAQGYCGLAVSAFELVAYGEIDAPEAWVAASKRNIETLENDDGTLCSDWD